ncbi:MAG: hypothetical protein LBV41_09435, partial [Cytophagaceae bacterium]|nr:hypothetical protein [Cytophagaceae bacterium]
MKKFTFLLCGVMLCAAMNAAFAQSGDTGSLHWELADGTLTITGSGAMPDYASGTGNTSPW